MGINRYTLTVILALILLGVLAAVTAKASGPDIICDAERCILSRQVAETLVHIIEEQKKVIDLLRSERCI